MSKTVLLMKLWKLLWRRQRFVTEDVLLLLYGDVSIVIENW